MSSEIADRKADMDLNKGLEELGLSKNKGIVYLASLQAGPASANEIAKIAGLPRTTTHEILQQLMNKGLASFVAKGHKRVYTAESPEKLGLFIKQKENLLHTILPDLFSLISTKGIRPKVKFYEGVEGVKSVFEDTLTVKNKLLKGILSMEDLYKIPGKTFMDDYVSRRVKAGLRLQVVRSPIKEVEETWPSSAKETRELHYAPAGFIFPMTVYIYDNKVSIIGTQKENFGMIIESEDFYKTLNNLFEILWQVTKGKG